MDENFDLWLTKEETRARTGLSERTLERKITAGEIRKNFRNIPGRKPIVILHPEDVARLEERTLKPIVVHDLPIPKAPQVDMTAFLSLMRPTLTIDKKLYLTLEEASQYAGLPKSYLKRQIKQGVIHAVKLAGWRVRRSDLETHNAVMLA